MGRYGQELGNIAAQALKQTTMLKKKCTNRTNKTVRQLRTARDGNCEAAEKAIETTRAAEKAVHNLVSFAGKPCLSTDNLAVMLAFFCNLARFYNSCFNIQLQCLISISLHSQVKARHFCSLASWYLPAVVLHHCHLAGQA